jgi:RNA-directed DNA polymerase
MQAMDNYSQILSFRNLLSAARKTMRGKKRSVGACKFHFYLEPELFRLQQELIAETYHPGDFEFFQIRDPKSRRICVAPFRDRVLHHAICNILEPILEKSMISNSFACRRGKGTLAAIEYVHSLCSSPGYFLKCDISRYFDSIDHEILANRLARRISDPRLMQLLRRIIQTVLPHCDAGKGIPIGNLTSQHFANFYLSPLDHFIQRTLKIKGYCRYMDDFLLFSDDKSTLRVAEIEIRQFLMSRLNLSLKERALVLAPVSEGVPFIGFRFFPAVIRLQKGLLKRWRRKLTQRFKAFEAGSLSEEEYLCSVSSLMGFMKHAHSLRLRQSLYHGFLDWGHEAG